MSAINVTWTTDPRFRCSDGAPHKPVTELLASVETLHDGRGNIVSSSHPKAKKYAAKHTCRKCHRAIITYNLDFGSDLNWGSWMQFPQWELYLSEFQLLVPYVIHEEFIGLLSEVGG